MTFPDEQLLTDFDESGSETFTVEQARALLASPAGDVYRSHLVAASMLDQWIEGLTPEFNLAKAVEEVGEIDEGSAAFHAGYLQAVRDVAGHLRYGELAPGGVHYEDQLALLRASLEVD